MPETADAASSRIAKTYAYTLLGLLIWPVLIAAYVRAGKAGATSQFEASHRLFQRRTAKWALIAIGTVAAISIVAFLSLEDAFVRRVTMIQLSNLFYVIWGWAGIRSARALYLAGAGQVLANPATFWMWPAAVEPARA